MRLLIQLLGTLLTLNAQPFHRALTHPQQAQRQIQQKIFHHLLNSTYGKTLPIHTLQDWHQIPIICYEDIQPWIEQQRHTTAPLLTPDRILFYEKTSGSRGPAKTIPYTRALRHAFSHLFCIWAADLIRHGPKFSTGKIYFCISPQFQTEPADRPTLQNDADYLDGWLRSLLRPFWISPALETIHHPEQFKQALCLTLLQAEQLEIISIWSPSFLTVHLHYIETHRSQLRQALQGKISPQRDRLLATDPINWTALWPHLKLISCWDSAHSADSAASLRSRFPGVLVQGKGLLATEAPLTVPLIQAQGCLPLLNQVFFEFEDDTGTLFLLHELQIGQTYTVIVSQQGGLYRYRLGDRLRVTHFYRNTPCLEFLGRTHTTSDLVGEKLHIEFVQTVLANLPLPNSHFQSLVPVLDPPHYILLLDQATLTPNAIAQQLEIGLMRSHHYRHARQLGQLQPAQVIIAPHIADRLTQLHLQTGKTWGDIKHPLLVTQPIPSAWIAHL